MTLVLDRRTFLLGGLAALGRVRLQESPNVNDVAVQLIANTRRLGLELINFGLPLPPGVLSDPRLVRVFGSDQQEIEAGVRPLEPWRYGVNPGSIRSVQVQCDVDFSRTRERRLVVRIGEPRQRDRATFQPIEKTLNRSDGLAGPRVLAVLPSEWLCASRVAGPQTPASQSGRYATYDECVERHFEGSLAYVDSKNAVDWLFDRTSAWYKAYVRTGQSKYLAAAYRAAHLIRTETIPSGPDAGAFRLRGADLKYVYPRAMHLHYLLTGDERALAAGKLMARFCLDRWNPHYQLDKPSGPGDASGEHGSWTPRHQGFGMLGVLHGWEMTGEASYWDKCREYADACYEHQTHPPDGRPPDGSWRLNWAKYDPSEAMFEGGASAWMTAILCDALFHYWTIGHDPRVPEMIGAWCDFLNAKGLQPDGTKAYYVINCFARPGEPGGVADDSMDLHNAEICHTFSMGTFFSSDAARKTAYRERLEHLLAEWTMTDLNNPSRAYNWALQASGQMIYLLQHTPSDV
jgi:hypothetical protein